MANKDQGITVYGCEQDEAVLFQEMARHFGVTPTITAAPLSEAVIALATGNRCVSVSHKTPVTRPLLLALSQAGVRYVSTRSAGFNHIDMDFARQAGITIGNVAYSPDSVADYTLMLMLMALRDAKSTLSRAALHDFRPNSARGKELRDMTVGVIGTGRIGMAVIDRLQGFGCRVLTYDRRPSPNTTANYATLDDLLQQSDIITLHTPLNEGTHHLLDSQRLTQMRDGAFIINTGRGALIDTAALVAALQNGKLGGAALDVLEGEEGIFYADYRNRPVNNQLLLQLLEMPNVIVTPHAAYYTQHALRDIVENTFINCLEFEKKQAVETSQKEEAPWPS